jgi:iron complex transport system substrate-binding protein
MRALREQRLCVFPVEEANVLVRPGPRMAEAARIMARCLVEKSPKAEAPKAERSAVGPSQAGSAQWTGMAGVAPSAWGSAPRAAASVGAQ